MLAIIQSGASLQPGGQKFGAVCTKSMVRLGNVKHNHKNAAGGFALT